MATQKVERGSKSTDKGTVVPEDQKVPYSPQNLHLSKAEFIEQERLRKEKALKLKEVSAEIDKEQKEKKETKVQETKKRPKSVA